MLDRWVVAGVVASLLAGCTTATPPPGSASASPAAGTASAAPSPAWTPVALPDGVRATSLASAGDDLLVGGVRGADAAGSGQTPEDAAPSLLVVRGQSVDGTFALRPADPYAGVADLVSVDVEGDEVFAIGTAVGGAHANPRRTVWDGPLAARRLTSRPQEFFTFGGHDAGTLLGTTVVGGTAVIVGSRVGATGLYGLLWTRKAHTWTPQEPPAELTSTPDREFSFLAFARLGSRLVVTGDELGLAGGLNQAPAAFVGGVDGGWRELLLPVPSTLERVAGQLSRATSVACPPAGETCWAAGWVRGRPLAWPVAVPSATAGEAVVLPGEAPAGTDAAALVTIVAGRPLVLTNAATPTAQVGCPDGWRTLASPTRPVTALAAAGDGVYAVADGRLWRLAVPSCS